MEIPKANKKTIVAISEDYDYLEVNCCSKYFAKKIDLAAFREEGLRAKESRYVEERTIVTHRNPQTKEFWDALLIWVEEQINAD